MRDLIDVERAASVRDRTYREALAEPCRTEADRELRRATKALAFGSLYGATARTMGRMVAEGLQVDVGLLDRERAMITDLLAAAEAREQAWEGWWT